MAHTDRLSDRHELNSDKRPPPISNRAATLPSDSSIADSVRDALLSQGDPFSHDAALLRNLLRLAREVIDTELRARVVASLLPAAYDSLKKGPEMVLTLIPGGLSTPPAAQRAAFDLAWTPPSDFPNSASLSVQPPMLQGFTITVRPPSECFANPLNPTADELQNVYAISAAARERPTDHIVVQQRAPVGPPVAQNGQK